MKQFILFFLFTATYIATAQHKKIYIESNAGRTTILSNNSIISDRPGAPLHRISIGHDFNNLRLGVTTSNTEYGFSSSTYSVSTVGLIGGYNIDFEHFGLSADAIVDYRLASLQRVGGQQITSGSLSPVDLVLRPSVFVRPIKTNQSVELVVGYELGLLDLDPTDAVTGISAKHSALTIGVRALFKDPSKPRESDPSL